MNILEYKSNPVQKLANTHEHKMNMTKINQTLDTIFLLSCTTVIILVGSLIVVSANETVEKEADPSSAAPEGAIEEDGYSVGWLDIVVLVAIAGGAYYYFFGREKEEDSAASNYVIQTTNVLQRQQSVNKGFINKMKNTDRRMVAFYGSQTGTAEEYASRLGKEGQMYGMRGVVADPEENEMEDLSKLGEVEEVLGTGVLAVFCLATYGEGDPTDNAQEFFDWLQGGAVALDGMRYAVIGLGNKTYENFNSMGTYVDTKLAELGAKRIHPLGLGDDDGNLEDDFITWKEQFWKSVCEEYNLGMMVLLSFNIIRQHMQTQGGTCSSQIIQMFLMSSPLAEAKKGKSLATHANSGMF